MARVLGLDYGEKHIGIAISDALGILASSLATLENKGKDFIVSEIKKICKENKVKEIIIGLPISLSGEQETQAKQVKEFAEFLSKEIDIPIVFEDERLTTIMADKFLKEKGTKIKDRKAKEHKLAAQIILQDYLDKNI